MAVPIQRLRRLRQHEAFRRMVRETSLTLSDLIPPLFVVEGRDRREVIAKIMALPKADLQNEGQVLQSSISRSVAGIWFNGLGQPLTWIIPVSSTHKSRDFVRSLKWFRKNCF